MWIAAAALAADRVTKTIASRALAPQGAREVLPGILSWSYTENTGMAFSLLSGRSILLIVLTLALAAGVLVYLIRKPGLPRAMRAGLWLVLGGGLGNLYDRIVYGGVIDFIRLDFVRFAIFNLADVCVCAGAALVLLSALCTEMRGGKRHE